MKRIGNLFDKIANMDNLILADMKARRGKKDSYGIRLFDKDKEGNLSRLLKSLLDGTFKTSKYRTDTIYEPKERIIFKLPYYPDRILHHAIMNVMEPIWVSVFTADTTSCIKGRGITEAYKRTRRVLSDRESVYCLKVDIRKFYPSKSAKPLKIPHKATPAASVRVQGNALAPSTNTAGDILSTYCFIWVVICRHIGTTQIN